MIFFLAGLDGHRDRQAKKPTHELITITVINYNYQSANLPIGGPNVALITKQSSLVDQLDSTNAN